MSERTLQNGMLCEVSYDDIINACKGQPYTMSIVGDECSEIMQAVNQGIDSCLEACYVPDRGDLYHPQNNRLECIVSPESLCCLIRRLCEKGSTLGDDILFSLGFDEYGRYVGREALGLE